VAALHALGIKRMVGVTYTDDATNAIVVRYFQEAGIDLVSLDCVGAAFDRRGFISHYEVYALTKAAAAKVPGIDGIFLFGSGWRSLEAIQLLEDDLGIPVVHAVPARVWTVQRMLNVRQPVKGFGHLLESMPDMVS
jgi:maleate isomerase